MFTALFVFPLILIVGTVSLLLTGTRESPARLYLAFMTLTGVLLLLYATLLIAHGLTQVSASQVVLGAIAGAVAVGLLWFHLPKLEQTAAAQLYSHVLYLACAAAMLTAVTAAASAVYAIYTIGPRSVVTSGALAVVAAYIFSQGWKRTTHVTTN